MLIIKDAPIIGQQSGTGLIVPGAVVFGGGGSQPDYSPIDMTTETLPSRLRYTCASSRAYHGADDLISYAAPNVSQLEYINGATGRSEPEPQSKNIYLYSSDFTKWTATRVTVANTATAGAITGHTMQRITATETQFPRVTVTRPLTAGDCVMQIIVKPDSTRFLHGTIESSALTDNLKFFCDMQTLTAQFGAPLGGMVARSINVIPLANGCVLLTVKFTAPATGNYITFFGPSNALGSTSAVVGASIYADTAMLEQGTNSTSLILCNGAATIRYESTLSIETQGATGCIQHFSNGDTNTVTFDGSEWYPLPLVTHDWGYRYGATIEYITG